MIAALEGYRRASRRRGRRAERDHQRLDIQGLRMIAVVAVFASHLWHWPPGGFVGVDVFFVISGFLITGNLLRTVENTGTVSFRHFYWNRLRRIIPAACVVLVLTCLVSTLMFLPFRSHHTMVDAYFAFAFLSNWWFAVQHTDYFATAQSVSPLQHYWSLSLEEQFYFVWPALVFGISVIAVRKARAPSRRTGLAAGIMVVLIGTSFGWAVYETGVNPSWAYFETFSRVWELGVGALLAVAVKPLSRIPAGARALLSWTGLGLIVMSLGAISDDSVGFPAPWALLPVSGAALTIAAGVGGEPGSQHLLRNPLSTYIGNISYSLYLVHWPVIVIIGAIAVGPYRDITVVAVAFGLAIASYHFIETPLRRLDLMKIRRVGRDIIRLRFRPTSRSGYAALAAASLLVLGMAAYTGREQMYEPAARSRVLAVARGEVAPTSSAEATKLGPLGSMLQKEIADSLRIASWPQLDPSVEAVVNGPKVPSAVAPCSTDTAAPDPELCTWGSASAPIRIVVIGDSVAMGYVEPLREIALASAGRIQVHTEAMLVCDSVEDMIVDLGAHPLDSCPARKEHAVDFINATKPNIVIIANSYNSKKKVANGERINPEKWADSMRRFADKFRDSVGRIVLISPPAGDKSIGDCYGLQSNTPLDCIGQVRGGWLMMADVERNLAMSIGGVWIDSRPWFCNSDGLCPSFVTSTPTKSDMVHMVPQYGVKISTVIDESLIEAKVF